jgi:hypothetical protein
MRYGSKNKKDSKSQYIYLRIKHNNLDWDKSLKIRIDANDWDFKKGEVTTKHSFGNPLHSKNVKEVSEKVSKIYYSLKQKAESFAYSNHQELKEMVRNKERKAFIELCDRWFRDYKEGIKQVSEPYIAELYKEIITARFNTGDLNQDRFIRVMNIYRNISAFESYFGRKIRTNELSVKLWANEMIPFFQDEYEHGIHSESGKNFSGIGLSTSVIKMIKNAFQQTARKKGKYHSFDWDILNNTDFTIKVIKPAKSWLAPQQIKSIISYKNPKIKNLESKLWFISVMYYGCFRINEVYKSLEGKTPKQVFNNEVTQTLNSKGKMVYSWKCYNSKQDNIDYKNLPMFDKLGELLFGGFENAEKGIFPDSFPRLFEKNTIRRTLQQVCDELSIEGRIIAHTIRRSFLKNLKKKSINHTDMMQYSGHRTEAALIQYLDNSDNQVPTNVNLEEEL